jgi:hypothetical protein
MDAVTIPGPASADSHPFVMRYPEGHQHAGFVIGRVKMCRACSRDFKQFKVNPDYLDAMSPALREKYVEECDCVVAAGVTEYWQPKFCPMCVRRQIR